MRTSFSRVFAGWGRFSTGWFSCLFRWQRCAFVDVSLRRELYRFDYYEANQSQENSNRALALKIEDVHSLISRAALTDLAKWRVLPRSYLWALADIVRTRMEGRAYSTYAFGRLTFMQPR